MGAKGTKFFGKKVLKNLDPNLFISGNGVCQLSPFPKIPPPQFWGALLTPPPPPPGSENQTCPAFGLVARQAHARTRGAPCRARQGRCTKRRAQGSCGMPHWSGHPLVSGARHWSSPMRVLWVAGHASRECHNGPGSGRSPRCDTGRPGLAGGSHTRTGPSHPPRDEHPLVEHW